MTEDYLLIDYGVSYTPTTADLRRTRVPFDEVEGLSGANATAVAGALEDYYTTEGSANPIVNDPDLEDILSGLFVQTDAALYSSVLRNWAGGQHGQVMRAALNMADPYHTALSEHLNDGRSGGAEPSTVTLRDRNGNGGYGAGSGAGQSAGDEKGTFWGRAIGRWVDRDGDENASGYDESMGGVVLGFDYQVSDNFLLGIGAMYLKNNIDFDEYDDEADIERWLIGGYGSYTQDNFYLDASFSYASDDYEVSRTVVYGDTSCLSFDCATTAEAEYDGDLFQTYGEFGWALATGNGNTLITPFAGISYVSLKTDEFTETGAGDLNLIVEDTKAKSVQTKLGARVTWTSTSESGTVWIPEIRAEWRHEFKDNPVEFDAALSGAPNANFTAIGSRFHGDFAVIGAGVTAVFGSGASAYLDYQLDVGSWGTGHTIMGGAQFNF